jgi:hypothetical protein
MKTVFLGNVYLMNAYIGAKVCATFLTMISESPAPTRLLPNMRRSGEKE